MFENLSVEEFKMHFRVVKDKYGLPHVEAIDFLTEPNINISTMAKTAPIKFRRNPTRVRLDECYDTLDEAFLNYKISLYNWKKDRAPHV